MDVKKKEQVLYKSGLDCKWNVNPKFNGFNGFNGEGGGFHRIFI